MNLSQAALNKLWQQQSKPTQMHASKDLTGKIVDQGTGALSFDNFSRTLSADYSSSRILDSECPIWRQPTKSYPFVGVIFSTASMQHYFKKIKIFLGFEKMFDESATMSHILLYHVSVSLCLLQCGKCIRVQLDPKLHPPQCLVVDFKKQALQALQRLSMSAPIGRF
jgi:hypothetical protein